MVTRGQVQLSHTEVLGVGESLHDHHSGSTLAAMIDVNHHIIHLGHPASEAVPAVDEEHAHELGVVLSDDEDVGFVLDDALQRSVRLKWAIAKLGSQLADGLHRLGRSHKDSFGVQLPLLRDEGVRT